MGSWASIGIFLGGIGLGAAFIWLFMQARLGRSQTDFAAAKATLETHTVELAEARREVDHWRVQHQAEQLERARFETEARRVAGLELELESSRVRTESLSAQKAALEIEAERVSELESRATALSEQLTSLTAANAELQTRLREQAQAHAEKVAMLVEVRGEIEKDLKNITSDALRAHSFSSRTKSSRSTRPAQTRN